MNLPPQSTNFNTTTSSQILTRLKALYDAEDYLKALDMVQAEISVGNVFPELLSLKTSILMSLEKYQEAVKAADDAIESKPKDYIAYHMKGTSLYHLGEFEQALPAFDQSISLEPRFQRSVNRKVATLIALGRFRDAANLFEASDLPMPDRDSELNNIGYMYLKLGDMDRAEFFLHKARRLNPFSPWLYANLAQIYRSQKRYFLWFFAQSGRIITTLLFRVGVGRYLDNIAMHLQEYWTRDWFWSPGKLFKSSSQARETKSILKLLRSPNMYALCNDSWNWYAVNIPYNVIDADGPKGDIDILLKRPRYFSTYDAGFTYRAFEVKATLVNKHGDVKGAHRGSAKHRKIVNQLKKLNRFGAEQVFLLEVFVLERGYSTMNRFPSVEIEREIRKKAKALQPLGFGYVIMVEEPSTTYDDESGGIYHQSINVLAAKSNPTGEEFQKLADGIDAFIADPFSQGLPQKTTAGNKSVTIIGYCGECKRLTIILSTAAFTTHICARCRTPMC